MRHKRKTGITVKGKKVIFLAMAAVLLAGCARQMTVSVGLGDKESEDSGKQNIEGTYRSCIIQEDAEHLYLCGSYKVSKVNKETGTTTVLWENKDLAGSKQSYLYSRGSGLLLGDRIYFIERWMVDDVTENRALSCVRTDGSGYERIDELDWYSSDGMLLQDGTLYLDTDNNELRYQVYEDGTISKQEIFPVEDVVQVHHKNNGSRVVFQKEQIEIPESFKMVTYNEKYLLGTGSPNDDGTTTLLLKDRETSKEKALANIENYYSVVCMDDAYVYILCQTGTNKGDTIGYSYEKIALETGERKELFSQTKKGFGRYVSHYLMDVVVQENYIYYADELDGKFYLMRRNMEEIEDAEPVGEAFYDSGVGTIASVESLSEAFYTKNKDGVYYLKLSWMQVDERFPGAEAINAYMVEYKNAVENGVRSSLVEVEDFIGLAYECSSEFTGFHYFDNRYISFVQSEYDYTGGAHGMPNWENFTFDLETGKRLLLSDITTNSEEELKEIVARYFAEKINQRPEEFWDDAVETVQNGTGFDCDFYLTEQGIVFYYGPYALASYAAGFQTVTVPYEEFDMKITLEKASNAQAGTNSDGQITQTEENIVPEDIPVDGMDWGVSYGEPETQPRGNAPVEILAQYDAYYMDDADEKVIYLTFDCGYENGNTEAILDALKKHDVPATFFVVGHYLETAPELVKRMVEEGHAVGSHTYNHIDVTKLSDKQAFQEEMDAVRNKFKEVTGEELAMYYRPPEGKCYSENLLMAKELGYSTIFWSLAHVDWDPENQPGRKSSVEKLTTRIHPGAVVLLHNTSKTNGEILDELLTKWEEMGYTVRPLSELVEE